MPKVDDVGYGDAASADGTEKWLVKKASATVRLLTSQIATYAFGTKSANVQSFLNAANYSAARTALGVALGSDVQAYNANLTTYAGIAPSANVQTLLGSADFSAFRTSLGLGSAALLGVDTDGTLAANSDSLVPSQKAVKTAIATAVTGLLDFKGNTDCSANPNYPAASKGDAYAVSVAGKIGGASGVSVDVGDMYVASADNAGGTQASVGTSWFVLEHNLVGAATAGAITSSGLTQTTARLLGRTTASTGAIEEISVASNGLTFAAGALSLNIDSDLAFATGALRVAAFTGDVTKSAGGTALTIANDAVTYAKMQNVSATSRILGRKTAGAGDTEELTAADVATILGQAVKSTESIIIAASDETTALTTGTGKVTFRMPYAFTVTDIRASLTTAQTSGSIFTVDVNESGTTIISTKLTIDNTEKTTTTAATPPVISDSALADDAEITVDIDQIGDGTAKGLKVVLIGYRT